MEKTINIPPIKIQGKKSKLVNWIRQNMPTENIDRFVEPFFGSGVVGFNIAGEKALFADSNPHIIRFYNAIKSGEITPGIAKHFLEKQGSILSSKGQSHYNFIREKFNENGDPLDFLFLNRSCFNGMIRFNRHLKFNVPYNHKPERFAQAYVTKIYNQIKNIQQLLSLNDWDFVCRDFRKTLAEVKPVISFIATRHILGDTLIISIVGQKMMSSTCTGFWSIPALISCFRPGIAINTGKMNT